MQPVPQPPQGMGAGGNRVKGATDLLCQADQGYAEGTNQKDLLPGLHWSPSQVRVATVHLLVGLGLQ